MTSDKLNSDRLLTEIERQQKYLAELPEDFEYPLFNSAKALESQRRSGYRTTASAAREIVDNAVEAGASRVHIIFDEPRDERRKGEHRESVSAVAFVDDGAGMVPKMARYALSWGGGTHFDDPNFIGKFGFGLPNASINQTQRVEVYTRTEKTERWTKAWLDINDYKGFGTQTIPMPVQGDLPKFVESYLKQEGIRLDHGTVVVWVRPDRLTFRKAANLKEHLVDDFGVTYRNMLKNFELKVEGVVVQPMDPLFLDPKARYYLAPEKGAKGMGGAQLVAELDVPVKYTEDPVTGSRHLVRIEDPSDLEDPNLLQHGVIKVRVARLPLGFAVSKGRKGDADIEPIDGDAAARFEIRKTRRGMSFVRAGREIHTLEVFPHRIKDEASGLGRWPLLQGYAYHWGVEVRFEPHLDEVFGIGNDKQTVRPMEDFWRVMVQEKLDEILRRENRWQAKARKDAAEAKATAQPEVNPDEPTKATMAAQVADITMGKRPKVPERLRQQVREEAEKRAQEEAERTQRPVDDVLAALEKSRQQRDYRVETMDAEYGPFFIPKFDLSTIVVQINRMHPFFSVLYGKLLGLPGGAQAKEAVDLVLIALAKGELGEHEETSEVYRMQRETLWSPFLAAALRNLATQFEVTAVEEEVEQDGDDDEAEGVAEGGSGVAA